MSESNWKIDPLTGEKFVPKNSLQKFARLENKIKYNNLKAKKYRDRSAFIYKPLYKNHKILIELIGNNTTIEEHAEFLKGRGFDFKKFTGWMLYNGKKYPLVYEFVLIFKPNQIVKIIKMSND
jgi:hypothetical protein